jgi:Icc-related predicted phosphoesterase
MIRVAAVGDVHLGPDVCGTLRPHLADIGACADALLLAGDLTQHGTLDEAEVVAAEFSDLRIPVIAVLGNHDYQCDRQDEITGLLQASGINVLEGTGTVLSLPAGRLGVAGTKGFGAGFPGRCGSEFGEPEMKEFVRHSRRLAEGLDRALRGLDADVRVALTHYAPVADTLAGEPPEIYPFLGSYFLAEAIDHAGADLAVHGHAHAGQECGVTPGGTSVRNVALPVLRRAYAVYHMGRPDLGIALTPVSRGREARTASSEEVPMSGTVLGIWVICAVIVVSLAVLLTTVALAARRPHQEHPEREPLRGLVQGGQHVGGGRSVAPTRDAPVPEGGGEPPTPEEEEAANAGRRPPRTGSPMDL